MSVVQVTQNDTGTALVVTCTNIDGSLIDLTNCTVNLEWTIAGAPLVTKEMAVVNAAAGQAAYTFSDNDVGAPGLMTYRVCITFPGGAVLTTPQSGSIKIVPVL